MEFIVKEFARHLELDGYRAQKLEVINGQYTGRQMGDTYFGFKKSELIKHIAYQNNLNLNECYAYSDSVLDIEMLRAVGKAIAVNPDKNLKLLAIKNKWEVLYWQHNENKVQRTTQI